MPIVVRKIASFTQTTKVNYGVFREVRIPIQESSGITELWCSGGFSRRRIADRPLQKGVWGISTRQANKMEHITVYLTLLFL